MFLFYSLFLLLLAPAKKTFHISHAGERRGGRPRENKDGDQYRAGEGFSSDRGLIVLTDDFAPRFSQVIR